MPGTQRIFTSDNTAGASPEIVQAVTAAAAGQDLPYGADRHTASARARFAESSNATSTSCPSPPGPRPTP
ncbi:hypothetical protein ABZ070_31640 [Streptomyces sp. NPDC006283]|uniref:hypothetical protein n=1 Tax=Streptomyces sp. NPDC006283 TaxID=3156741 RepID=UPI0033AA7E71